MSHFPHVAFTVYFQVCSCMCNSVCYPIGLPVVPLPMLPVRKPSFPPLPPLPVSLSRAYFVVHYIRSGCFGVLSSMCFSMDYWLGPHEISHEFAVVFSRCKYELSKWPCSLRILRIQIMVFFHTIKVPEQSLGRGALVQRPSGN